MQLKVKKQKEETVEVELPVFYKKVYGEDAAYIGALNEQAVIKFSDRPNYKCHQNCEAWLMASDIAEAVENWDKITEGEFLAAHSAFLQSLSLVPVLNENPDDLKGIFEPTKTH